MGRGPGRVSGKSDDRLFTERGAELIKRAFKGVKSLVDWLRLLGSGDGGAHLVLTPDEDTPIWRKNRRGDPQFHGEVHGAAGRWGSVEYLDSGRGKS